MANMKAIVDELPYVWARHLTFDEPPNHQTLPSPHTEVDEAAWWRKFVGGHECLVHEAFVQIYLDGANSRVAYPKSHPAYQDGWVAGPLWSCHVRVYPSEIWVVAHHFIWSTSSWPNRMPTDASYRFIPAAFAKPGERTGYITRFFQVGCRHEHIKGEQLGNCWRRSTCTDCGYSWEIDSSG